MKRPTIKNTDTKLSIAFVLDDGLDKPDGVQQNILTFGKWFADRGHKVTYLVGETKRKDIPGVVTMSRNIKVVFNGNKLTIPTFTTGKKIKSALKKHNFDVIHVQVPYHPLMGARIVHFAPKDTLIVGTFHIMPNDFLAKFGTKLLGMALYFNLKKFDRQFAVSQPAVDFAKSTFGIDSEVLPNPVNVNSIRKAAKKKRSPRNKHLNITFLGRLVPRKGCHDLLKAISILHKNGLAENIFVNICGDGPDRRMLEEFVESNEINHLVRFHGFIAENDKPKFLHDADIAVFPSSGGESFGIVLIEAMAAGSGVVIGADNVGYSSVLEPIGDCLFEKNSPIELAVLLQELVESKKLRNRIHKKQQSEVNKYDVEVIGKKLEKYYYRDLKLVRKSLPTDKY